MQTEILGGLGFSPYICGMNQVMTILTQRELFLIIIGSITYIALFVVTVQNSRRKILLLRQRLEKIHAMQEEQEAKSLHHIEQNRQKIAELENLLQKMGDENSMLRLELEEKKARLGYANTMAIIENQKRQRAETAIFASDIYLKMKHLMAEGRSMDEAGWQQLTGTREAVQPLQDERAGLPRVPVDKGAYVTEGHCHPDGPLQGEHSHHPEPPLPENLRTEGLHTRLGRIHTVIINP